MKRKDASTLHNFERAAQETQVRGALSAIMMYFCQRSAVLKFNMPEPLLIAAIEEQDHIFATAFRIVEDAIAARAFPAASIAITHQGKLIALKTFGCFTFEDNRRVATETLFDLASVTKVIATTSMAMILYEHGLLELDAPVVGIVPEFTDDLTGNVDQRRTEVTLRMLLAHSSGLPAHEKFYLKFRTRPELLHAAFTTPLIGDPGSHAEYSDIGFIILGIALERLAEESLDKFCQREIFGPLVMLHTTFNPPQVIRGMAPPTALDETFRERIIRGEVQDENAFVLGGVAGHAGLFSTAGEVAKFAHAILSGGSPILRPETISLFTRRESTPPNTSRALGWDTPSSPSQSGKYFSASSFGHLGYTGTSLWIDPSRQFSVTLLTNRTWPDCSNQTIKQVRPHFHDAIVEALQLT